jgi:hypothetical protein
MAVHVHIPWYATVFRGDKLEAALHEIAAVSLKYGATDYAVFRYHDDRYKFLQHVTFDEKVQWERYWDGPDFIDWRVANNSYFQVPVVYGMVDVIASGDRRPTVELAGSSLSEQGAGDLAG